MLGASKLQLLHNEKVKNCPNSTMAKRYNIPFASVYLLLFFVPVSILSCLLILKTRSIGYTDFELPISIQAINPISIQAIKEEPEPNVSGAKLEVRVNLPGRHHELYHAIRKEVGSHTNFLLYPRIRRKVEDIVDVAWTGEMTKDMEKLLMYWEDRSNNRTRAILVGLRTGGNWAERMISYMEHLPTEPEFRIVLVGHYTQNFGTLNKIQNELKESLVDNVLEDARIVCWFVNQGTVLVHPKIISIPLGVNNWPLREYVKHIWTEADEFVQLNPERECMLSVVHQHRDGLRAQLREHIQERISQGSTELCILPSAIESGCTVEENKCWKPYIQTALRSLMAFSPPGVGFDCHRTYEILACGVVPVLEHSSIDRTFSGLPVLFVDDLDQVLDNETSLFSNYMDLLRDISKFDFKRLRNDYWENLIILMASDPQKAVARLQKLHPI